VKSITNQSCQPTFSALLRVAPDTVLRLDHRGTVRKVLHHGDRLTRAFEAEEAVGKIITELYPRSLAERILQAGREAVETGRVVVFTHRIEGEPEEESYEVRIAAEKGLPSFEGRHYVMILRNITDSVRSDDYRRMIEKIFEDATEAILILSRRRNHIHFNDAFCRLFGLSCQENVGRRLADYREFFEEEAFRIIEKSLRFSGTFHGEVKIHRPDGGSSAVWMSVNTVCDTEGEEIFQVCMFTDVSELRESREMLRFTATHDSLTGLPNRRMLLNHLEKALARSNRYGHSGAVFFIDLDNFKDINDSLGHRAGDAVLIECASRVKSVIRRSDIFGRLGGDEFLLITEEITSPDALMHLAQKIISVINTPYRIGKLKHHIGASIGVAIFPHDGKNRDELLQYADMAMYRAKEKGKNRYQFYSSQLDKEVRRHFIIEKALRYAVENDGFYLVFQPQVDLSSEVIVGLEVLIRIDERIAGPLSPTEFIPIAEESDLILQIGRWVFSRTCQLLYRWREEKALRSLQVSINLSRRQLMDESWVDFVRKQIGKYGIDPTRIEFEITETAFMRSEQAGYESIRRLQELGCRISIDDFGTGYSSLASLKEFTVDKLKIDKSFIDDIAENPRDRTLVKAAIAMAHAMGLTTIAEGIETDDQKRVVKLLGCKEMQGYLFSRPIRAPELIRLMREHTQKGRIASR
jgi:diguanylate cyclase (GGDEF)-like protein/PAS domain S-box-containing protein